MWALTHSLSEWIVIVRPERKENCTDVEIVLWFSVHNLDLTCLGGMSEHNDCIEMCHFLQ